MQVQHVDEVKYWTWEEKCIENFLPSTLHDNENTDSELQLAHR